MIPGALNLITDIAGLRVGNAEDHTIKTGTTVLVGDKPFRASVDVMGGSPGTRETDLLAPDKLVSQRQLLQEVWGPQYGDETNYLRVHMAHIRRKLEPEAGNPRYFLTEPGMGYRYRSPDPNG